MRKVVRWAAAVLACYAVLVPVIFVFLWLSSADTRSRMDVLRNNGFVTTGTITSFEPHNGVCYSYIVGVNSYNACSGDHYPGEDLARQAVGRQLPVVYDEGNPSISCSCDPEAEYQIRNWPTVVLQALVFGLMVTFLVVVVTWGWLRRTSIEAGRPLKTETRQPL